MHKILRVTSCLSNGNSRSFSSFAFLFLFLFKPVTLLCVFFFLAPDCIFFVPVSVGVSGARWRGGQGCGGVRLFLFFGCWGVERCGRDRMYFGGVVSSLAGDRDPLGRGH